MVWPKRWLDQRASQGRKTAWKSLTTARQWDFFRVFRARGGPGVVSPSPTGKFPPEGPSHSSRPEGMRTVRTGLRSGGVWPGRRTVPGRGRPQGRPPLTPGSPQARFPPPSEGGRTGHRRDTRAGGYPRERLRLGQGSASSPCGRAPEVPRSQRSSLASPPSPPLKNPPEGLSNSSQTECMEPCGR